LLKLYYKFNFATEPDNISISSYVHNGVWIDAGTWEDLKKAKSIFL
jgi:NDP-sugar pyrophosphorylase family protein